MEDYTVIPIRRGLLIPGGGGGAGLAIDIATASTATGAGASVSWNHTTSGTDRAMIVGAGGYQTDATQGVCTYNSDPMTAVDRIASDNQSQVLEMFKISNPDTGGSYAVEWTPDSSKDELFGIAVSFTGAHQTVGSLTGTAVQETNCTTGLSVSSAVGEIVIDIAGAYTNAAFATNDGGMTLQDENDFAAQATGAMATAVGATSVTMDWAATNPAGHIGVSVKPAP